MKIGVERVAGTYQMEGGDFKHPPGVDNEWEWFSSPSNGEHNTNLKLGGAWQWLVVLIRLRSVTHFSKWTSDTTNDGAPHASDGGRGHLELRMVRVV